MDLNPKADRNGHEAVGKLEATWCLWEKYQSTNYQTRENYAQSMQIIYEFGTLDEFAAMWKHTSYGHPSTLFFDVQRFMSKRFALEEGDEEKVAESLLLFRKGVTPEWEDPANKYGSSMVIEFKEATPAEIDEVWKSLVFGIVGNSFPHGERVMGLRFLDRLKKHQQLKCEVWTSVPGRSSCKNKEEADVNEKLMDDIINHFHKLCSKTFSFSVHSITTKDHNVANKV